MTDPQPGPTGAHTTEQKDKNHRELHHGSFARSVQLPRGTKPEEVSSHMVEVRREAS